ncbi:TetR/AcrR family transcriptional regulator C-terminal domain-containing protein [Labrys sedimenti]|uniref:TetR/AcrR family transcriptional regulator C-terminal domain-containing protein n=1 Tax=Labrys sedimenti TaxID=3106036 RepID=UPI002ACAAD61|nr:TetR/AcrR family transcriptional regulator C-terminal domain-containing protein [Labrys sp. ZIDIC5]MDZ5454430.1 TetR/AcrR family transcriptional regulator C-terminal domain-containing protein [Labrys sp. ZIDIC5]
MSDHPLHQPDVIDDAVDLEITHSGHNERMSASASQVSSWNCRAIRAPAIDTYGSPVAFVPRQWLVCFVPGLQQQWWHCLAHRRHKHVFALLRNSDDSWTLFEPWWSRLLVATINTDQALPFLRWAALGDVLAVTESIPGAGGQLRGWMNCAALTSFLLGRSYWTWTPHGLYRRLLRETKVKRIDVGALFADHFSMLASTTWGRISANLRDAGSQDSLACVLRNFGCAYLTALTSHTSVLAYRSMIQECADFPEAALCFWENGIGRAVSHLTAILEAAKLDGHIDLDDCSIAANQFLGLLRGDLHLKVALGLRPPLTPFEVDNHVATAVDLFARGAPTSPNTPLT